MALDDGCNQSILFISQYFPPETGAAANRVDELTKRWADAGHDVSVVTSAPDYPEGEVYDGYDNRWHRVERRSGVTVHIVRTIPASNAGMGLRALKFIWFMIASLAVGLRAGSSPDTVVATSPQPLTGVSGAVVSTLRRATFVFEVRDLWPETIVAVSDIDSRLVVGTIEIIVKIIYRLADNVVIVSRAFEDEVVAAGVDPEGIWYHPNGVDPSFVTDQHNSAPLSDDIAEAVTNRFVVSYVGTIGRAHGLEVVLEAAEELEHDHDDILFLMVGYGAEKDELQQRARERRLSNVRFVGRKPKEMVPSILAATDVSLVHLKPRDLFDLFIPSKIFESMAAGLPIVIGVGGEAERIVVEANAGLPFEPGDGEELATAIRELYNDPDRCQRLGESGHEFVCSEFDWDGIAEEYLNHLVAASR